MTQKKSSRKIELPYLRSLGKRFWETKEQAKQRVYDNLIKENIYRLPKKPVIGKKIGQSKQQYEERVRKNEKEYRDKILSIVLTKRTEREKDERALKRAEQARLRRQQKKAQQEQTYVVTIKADMWLVGFKNGGRDFSADVITHAGPLQVTFDTKAAPYSPDFNEKIYIGVYAKYNDARGYDLLMVPTGKTPADYNISRSVTNDDYFPIAVRRANPDTGISYNTRSVRDVMTQIRIRKNNAPVIARFGTMEYNENEDECIYDYLCTKFASERCNEQQISALLYDNKPRHKQGVTLEKFFSVLQQMNISYWCVSPDLTIMEKWVAPDNFYNRSAYFYINNDHLYPIECKMLQQKIAAHQEGDPCLSLFLNKKLINFTKCKVVQEGPGLNDFILQQYKERTILPDMISINDQRIVLANYGNDITIFSDNYEIITGFIEQINKCLTKKIKFTNQPLHVLAKEILNGLGFHIKNDSLNEQGNQVLFGNTKNLVKPYLYICDEYKRCVEAMPDVEGCVTGEEGCPIEERQEEKLFASDIRRCHYTIMTNLASRFGFPIMSIYDEVLPYDHKEEIKTGFYYVDSEEFAMGYRQEIRIGKKWLDANTIQYCLDKKYLIKEEIKYKWLASNKITVETFKILDNVIAQCDLPDKYVKQLWNALAGMFGSYKSTHSAAFVTTSISTVDAYPGYEIVPLFDMQCPVEQQQELYVVKKTKLTEKPNNRAIYYSIICQEYIALDMMIQHINPEKILAIKTDCIYYSKADQLNFQGVVEHHKNIATEETPLSVTVRAEHINKTHRVGLIESIEPDYQLEDFIPKRIPDAPTIEQNIDGYDEEKIAAYIQNMVYARRSFALTGAGGTGKTHTVKNIIHPIIKDKKYCYTTVAHKALLNYTSLNYKCSVASTLFEDTFGSPIKKLLQYDYIIVDEVSMMPTNFMEMIYSCIKKQQHEPPNKKTCFILVGDFNQIPPVEHRIRTHYNYRFFHEMCNTIIKLSFTERSRYDRLLYDMLQNFLEKGTLCKINMVDDPQNLSHKNQYIAYTNAECNRINKIIYEQLTDNKDEVEEKKIKTSSLNLTTEETKEKPLRFISQVNNDQMKNNEMFLLKGDYLHSMDRDNRRVKFTEAIRKDVRLAFCITAHKSQGCTIKLPVVISQAHIMTKNMLYTAMSRAEKLENVLFLNTPLDKYLPVLDDKSCIDISNTDRPTGYIYQLLDKEGKIFYIGQTTNKKFRLKSHQETFGIETQMQVIQEIQYMTLKDLLKAEYNAVLEHIVDRQQTDGSNTHQLQNKNLVERALAEIAEQHITPQTLKKVGRKTCQTTIKEQKKYVEVVYYVDGIRKSKRFKAVKSIQDAREKATEFVNALV